MLVVKDQLPAGHPKQKHQQLTGYLVIFQHQVKVLSKPFASFDQDFSGS